MLAELRKCCAHIPQRWIFALMCFLALFNAYAMRTCLSIAITEMVIPTTTNVEDAFDADTCPTAKTNLPTNITIRRSKGTYEWSEYTQGLILSSFYWGYIVTHLPGGMIADKYGGKYTLAIGILLAALLTLLTPSAVDWGGATALIVLRVLMGLAEGTAYPAINALLARWTPPEERSRTGSFVYAGALMGTIYASALSGLILHESSESGWAAVFYAIGATSVAWLVVWLPLCYDSPREHPFISRHEADYLMERVANEQQPSGVPWRHILSSRPLWAVIVALIGFNWSILTLVTDLPKYMSGVLRLPVRSNGYLASLLYLCMWAGGTASSWLADYAIAKRSVSTTRVRKCASIIAMSGSSTFVVAVSYAGCERSLVVAMLAVAMTIMGAAFPSVMVNALDLSPNYAGTLMALTNGISALAGIASPYVIGVATPNQTLGEWRLVFWILLGVSVSANLVFLLYGSGEVENWNDPEFVLAARQRKRKQAVVEEVRV